MAAMYMRHNVPSNAPWNTLVGGTGYVSTLMSRSKSIMALQNLKAQVSLQQFEH
jgi:hypothetical protein